MASVNVRLHLAAVIGGSGGSIKLFVCVKIVDINFKYNLKIRKHC